MIAHRRFAPRGAALAAALFSLSFAASATDALAQSTCGRIVTVLGGESAQDVATRCGVTLDDVARMNSRLALNGTLEAGIEVLLPVEHMVADAPPEIYGDVSGADLQAFTDDFGFQPQMEIDLTEPAPPPAAFRRPLNRGLRMELGQHRVNVTPNGGLAPEGRVTVQATGFRGNERVAIGFLLAPPDEQLVDLLDQPFDVEAYTQASARGIVLEQVRLPEWLAPGDQFVVLVGSDDRPDRVVSSSLQIRGQAP